MADITKVLVIFFLCCVAGTMAQIPCTQRNYQICIQRLVPYIKGVQNAFFPNYSISLLTGMCQTYDSVKPCIESFQHNCPEGDRANLESMHGTYDYICKKARQGFIDHGKCLGMPTLHQSGVSCNSTFFTKIRSDVLGNPCGHFKEYRDCLNTAVREACGAGAASWYQGLDDATLKPLLELSGCRLDMHPHSYCTVTNHNRCAEPMRKHGLGEQWNIVANYPIPKMRAICESYRDVRPCIDTFLDNCSPATVSYYQGIHNTYQYVCDDHFEEYVRHSDCFLQNQLHHEGLVCNATVHFGLSSELYINGSAQYKRDRLCQHANTLIDCIENLVSSFCGAEAAAWQRGFDEVNFRPFFKVINCSFTPNHYPPSTSPVYKRSNFVLLVIVIPLGIAFLLLISVLLACCLCCKSKSRRNAQQEHALSEGVAQPGEHVFYNNYPPPQQPNMQGAALPAESLVPPPYTEKALTLEQMENAYAFAAQVDPSTVDEVKVPLPPDYENSLNDQEVPSGGMVDEEGYVRPAELTGSDVHDDREELVDNKKEGE